MSSDTGSIILKSSEHLKGKNYSGDVNSGNRIRTSKETSQEQQQNVGGDVKTNIISGE